MWPEPEQAPYAQGGVAGRDESGDAVVGAADADCTARTASQDWQAPVRAWTMLRIHFVRQWLGLSDLVIEEALFETALDEEFVGLCCLEYSPLHFGSADIEIH